MSYSENRQHWTCPNCGYGNWVEKGELEKCEWCNFSVPSPRGIKYATGYLEKAIADVIKFDVDHGIEGEHQPGIDNMIYHALCLAGEAGEVANVVKKIWRDGDSPQLRAHLAEEMVDLIIFASLLIVSGELDFDKAWVEKHEELYRRWANKKISRRKTPIGLLEVEK